MILIILYLTEISSSSAFQYWCGIFFLLIFCFFCVCVCECPPHTEVPRPGLNLHHSSDQSCCCDTASFLTCCATMNSQSVTFLCYPSCFHHFWWYPDCWCLVTAARLCWPSWLSETNVLLKRSAPLSACCSFFSLLFLVFSLFLHCILQSDVENRLNVMLPIKIIFQRRNWAFTLLR